MSVCNDCTKTQPIARCITNLIVGTITSLNTAVMVYIKDISTERTIEYSVTTSGTGLITIPITPQRFSEDHAYELHVTLASAVNISVKENITIGGDVDNCVNLRFKTIWDNNNAIATYANQTLTL